MKHCFVKQSARLRFLLVTTFILTATIGFSQTVDCSVPANCANAFCDFAANVEKGCRCFDNIDNDGDGRIDKADSNCATYYGLTFVGEGSDCSIVPPGANTPFDLVNAPITSSQNTADTQSKISVGDVDGDGDPDAVITSKWNAEMRVVATTGPDAGDVISDFKLTGQGAKIFSGSGDCDPKNLLFEHENLIADIDGNGKAELFGVVSNRGGNPSTPPTCFFLVAFTWAPASLVPLYDAVQIGTDRPGTFGIADMDGDGKAELYLRDRIYAAETGKLLATANGNWDLDVTSAPVAVNISGDTKMELVCGTKIYGIPDLSNRNPATPAALTLLHDMNTLGTDDAFVKLMIDPIEYGEDTHSSCSVADIDRDGNMDVVISGALNSTSGPTTVFYWNVAKSRVTLFSPPDAAYANGWPWGTGRVNLGDPNGDGLLDLSFIAGNRLWALKADLTTGVLSSLWASFRTINDSRSGVLTVTIYDFDNDGKPEMVYRDSQQLAVIDGVAGTTLEWSAVCQSHTYTEGPIIADVNGDGGTDICVPCNTNNSFDIDDPIQQQALGQFRLYYSSANEWLPTRKVWNQPGYFVVNINDDLTLPFPQLDQNLIFGTGNCPNGLPGPQMPLNVFLNQVPHLSANGCPVFPAPDLSYVGDNPDNPGVDSNGDGIYTPTVEVIPPICGDLAIQVRFNIINDGDLPISGDIPVSFFKADPTLATTTIADRLFTSTITLANLAVDSTLTTSFLTFNGTGGTFRLYIVLNNNGATLPINPNGTSTTECRIDNNIYSLNITPDPFTTKIEKIQDNFKCSNAAPDNGEVRVRIFKGAVEQLDYSPYAFQWYTGPATSPVIIPGATNYNLTGLAEGDYTARVTNTLKGCTGVFVDTTIVRLGNDPTISINVLSHQTVCNPPNGKLEALVAGGSAGYTFEWFDIALNPLGITGSIANNLTAGNYLVRASKDGCSKNSLPVTVDGPQVPDAQAQVLLNVVDCINPNSGSVSADALFNSAIQNPANYTFDWYFYNNATSTRGSILPPAHGTGQTRTGLPVGFYQVVIKDNATQCNAVQSPIVEVMSQTVIPTAVITELAPLTSCDPANPNGRMQAVAQVGGVPQNPAGFTFEWFKGDNTLGVNLHTNTSGVNGSIAEGVSGGGVFYTVKITTPNNCSDTEKLILTEDVNIPVITLTPSPNSICDPANATSQFNGSVTATVTFKGVGVTLPAANYQFTWHQGSLITDPVIAVADNTLPTLSQLNGGNYTAEVTRTDLGCKSLPDTKTVVNNQVLPTISTSATPSTNCAGGAANGAVTVTGVVPIDTYAYRWFDPASALIAGATTTSITGRQGGAGQNFSVEVTLNSTGCKSTLATNIPDNKLNPVLTLTPVDNSICDGALGFNGAITSTFTDTNSLAGHTYTYAWSTGSDMTNPIGGQTSSSLTQRNGGFYTSTITNVLLNCTSSPVTTQILNNQVLPAITTAPTPSTNCPGGADNGAITASVTNGLPGQTFAFDWHKGNLLTDPAVPVAKGGLTPTAFDQQGNQNYIVEVRNNQTGCENSGIQTIADNSVPPVLTLSTTDNSICDALLGFNGTVAQNTLTDNNTLPGDTYTFAWSTGSDMTAIIGGQTTSTLGGRNGGFHTATVRNNRLNCTSNPVTAQVLNNQILPAINPTPSPATNCPGGTNNGAITVSVTNALVGQTFAFEWHKGNLLTDPAVPNGEGGNTATISGQQGNQNYIVEVRNNQTGCENTLVQTIADNSVVPVLTLNTSDNSICDVLLGFNGTAFQNSLTDPNALGPDTYTFAWSQGSDMTAIIAGQTASTLSGRNGGFYTATVRNNRLNCTSNPVTVEIDNNQILPAITATPTPSTNCAAGTPNGEITIAIGNSAGPFTFEWHKGNLLADPVVPNGDGGNTATIINQQGGFNYTVGVTINATGCESIFTQVLADISAPPTFTLTVVNNQKCVTPFDGSLTIAGLTDTNSLGTDQYDVKWYDGAAVVLGGEDQTNNNVPQGTLGVASAYLARDNGFYTVTLLNSRLGCTSSPVTGEVLDNLTFPVITTAISPSTNCAGGTPNGSANVTGIVPADTYEHRWYAGAVVAPGVEINAGINDTDIIGLQGGAGANFTIEVTRTTTGCKSTETVTILDDSEVPVVLPLTHTDNQNCTAPFSGTATVPLNSVTYRGATINTPYAGFTLDFNGTNADNIGTLAAGVYSFSIRHNTDNCESTPVSVTVLDDLVYPVVGVNITDQTSCDPGQPNGRLEATETSGSGTYTFDWFAGIGVGAIGAGLAETSDGLTTQVLDSDDYTVLAANTVTRCQATVTVFLPDNIVNPSISFDNIVPVSDCNSPNGAARPVLTDVSTSPTPDFTIFYVRTFSIPSDPNPAPFDPLVIKASPDTYSSTAAIVLGANPPLQNNLEPGFLTALIVDNNTSCESSPTTIQIDDATVLNQISVGAVVAAGFCGGNGGSINITASGGAGGYVYEWYSGTPGNNNINFFNNPPDMTAAIFVTNDEDLGIFNPVGGAGAGTYTLVVRDAVGCGAFLVDNVPFAGAPVINITPVDPTKCVAPFDGSIAVTVTGTQNYSIMFFDGNNPASPVLLGEVCDDLADNDGDALSDQADPNCNGTEICGNAIDDDGDTLIDGADPDCGNESLTLNLLDAGQYLVRVIDYTPANRPCPLDNSVTLNQEGFAPVVMINQIDPNTACDDLNNADGSVEIIVAQDAMDARDPVTTPIDFEVFSVLPAPVNPPAFPAALSSGVASVTSTLNYGFGPQTYTLRIREVTSGCFVDQSVTIPDQPNIPQLLQVDITNDSFCAPLSNGSAEVTAVNPIDIDDYQYTWFSDVALTTVLYQANGTLGGGGGELFDVTKPGYSLGAVGQGIGTKTYYVRGERLPGTGPGVGCPTPAVTVVIQDEHVTPVATLTASPNTSCTPGTGEGSISITTITSSGVALVQNALYNYDINPDPNAAGPDPNNAGNVPFLFSSLEERPAGAPYTITATNEVSGCATTGDIVILPNKFSLNITNHSFTNQLMCNADGDITVTQIVIDRTLTGQANLTYNAALTNDFDFEWFRAPVATPGIFNPATPLQDGVGPATINREILQPGALAGQYPTMGAGAFYVIATRKGGGGATPPVVGLGCETPPLRVDIADQHINPVATLTPFSNTSCDLVLFEGEIEIDVTDASVTIPPTTPYTYNYTWTVTPNAIAPSVGNNGNGVNDGDRDHETGLEEGIYTVQVRNFQTGCQVNTSTTIFKNVTPIFVTDFEITPQLYCDASGKIEVTQITFEDRLGATVVAPLADFDFSWTRAGFGAVGTTAPLLDSMVNYPAIGAGQYAVFATRMSNGPGLGCASAPINVQILDQREFPVITLTPFSNTSCTAAFEGEIEVDITDASAAKIPPSPDAGQPITYDYTWTDVNAAGLVLPPNDVNQTGTNNLYQDLEEGTYRVSVVNDITGCTSLATTTIIKNQTPVFVQNVDVVPQLYCDPSGNLNVVQVRFNDRTGATQNGPLGDFTYTWSRGTLANVVALTDPTAPLPGHVGTELDSVVMATIGADAYFVVATRNLGTPGAGCSSAPFRVDILDQHVNPVIALSPFSNTSCTAAFEGEIEIDVTDASTAKVPPTAFIYDYNWTTVVTAIANSVGNNGNGLNDGDADLASSLQEGVYTLQATNTVTGCIATASATIIRNQTPVFITSISDLPQFYCLPSGRLQVTGVTFNDRTGATQVGATSDFTFTWARGTPATTVATTIGNTPRGTILDSLVYAAIGSDPDYYVVATRTSGAPGAGCSSAPVKVEIEDERQNPTIGFTTVANTACDNNFDGRITVLSSNNKAPGTGSNYNIAWTSVPAGNSLVAANNVGGTYTTPLTDVIGPGSFTTRVTNITTQCFSDATVTMISNPQPLEILTVTSVDQDICYADGSIQVNSLSTGTPVNYTFNWFRNSSTTPALVDGASATITASLLDATNYPTMGAGTFFVVGQKTAGSDPGSGCLTPPFRVDIKDLHVDPVVSFTYQPNSSCDPVNPNGVVIATAQEQNGSIVDNYSFSWTLNGGALLGATVPSTPDNHTGRLDDAADGTYVVTVLNVSNTGCTITGSLDVNKDLNISTPNIIDVTSIDPINCFPSASAEVTRISIGGVTFFNFPPDNLDNTFDYEWYRGNFAPGDIIAGEIDHDIQNLVPDKYYVIVQDLTTACKSTPKEVTINDTNIVYPVVVITQTELQVSCVGGIGTAELEALADAQSDANPNYSFVWFANLTNTAPSFATTSTISNLVSGSYSVSATNALTGCSDTELYIIPDDAPRFLPVISLATEARTNCLVPDGSLLAREIGFNPNSGYPFAANFSAEIYVGANANVTVPGTAMPNVPGFNLNWIMNGLDVGTFTVKITDNNTGCITTAEDAVLDHRTPPVVVVVEDNPLINCDPLRPNGQLSATADAGQVGGYNFDWFRGNTAAGAVLQNNNKLIGETIGQYTVRATNNITGCFADGGGTITDGTIDPPAPDAVVVLDRTHCIYPDGWVSASVGGITLNYSFDWYDGNTTQGAPDFNGFNYTGRDIGFYTVTVMDVTTGCISLPASVEVKDLRVVPELEFISTPSFCEDLPDIQQGSGTLTLQLVPADVLTDSVAWINLTDNTVSGMGSYITGLYPGLYQADVRTTKGCTASGIAEVKTEIMAYNLVTRNGDQKNDKFVVDCISRFPNNNVKIFNRAGVMVYEANGYNNNDVVFQGVGERGLYTTGNELPVGTYFFVIDKRDGTKPRTGYLELVK